VSVLARRGCYVCNLKDPAPIASNLLSYHLRLREAGLVTATRRGRWVDYFLHADGVCHPVGGHGCSRLAASRERVTDTWLGDTCETEEPRR